jgi:hypothetical protein
MPEWVDGPARDVPKADCYKVTVPTLFYNDHVWRDLTAGVVVTEGRYVTTVWLDRVALDDLIGDAYYYASHEGEDYTANRSVCDSAKRTLARLQEQTPAAVSKYRESMSRWGL